MADIQLNSVALATESGGTVTLDSATVIPAAGVTGTLPNAVQDNITRLGTVTAGNISNDAIVYPTGHVINTWYHGCTSSTGIAVATSTFTPVSTSANITITSGNKLVLWYGGGVFASAAKHWAWNIYIDGTSVGSGSWGTGIAHGSTAYTGWHYFGSQTVYPITSTGTVSCELKLRVNSGTVTVVQDGNDISALGDNTGWGYDGVHWIAQEIQG